MGTPVFKSYDQIVKDKAQAAYEQACEAGIAEILRSKEFSEIDPTIPGAKRALIDFCQRYASNIPGAVPSLFLLREAKKQNHYAFQQTFKPFMRSVQEQRQEVIFEILALLAAHGNMSEADLANERKRLNLGWTLDKLRARKEQILTAQRLARKTPAELRQMNQDYYESQISPTPLLPEEITAAVIKQATSEQIKKWIRVFGASQINTRLQG